MGQTPMFYHNIKYRKSVFLFFATIYFYIIKQMKKSKPCITLWERTPDIWEPLRNVENTQTFWEQFGIKFNCAPSELMFFFRNPQNLVIGC